MDFITWSAEYYEQANIIKEKIVNLKQQLKGNEKSSQNTIELNRRIAILYSMYLECIHTGRLLKEKGENKNEQ